MSVVVALMLMTLPVGAEDRLAVLEFFGRAVCSNCQAAGAVISELQDEYEGRALLLEYDVDSFRYGRQERYLVADPDAAVLPLVMVGSGFRTSSGWTDFEQVLPDMLDEELARPPRASVSAFWRRNGSFVRTYVTVENTGSRRIQVDRDAGIWVIAYENAAIGLTTTWVQSQELWYLPYSLAPGEHLTATIDTGPLGGPNWSRMTAAVLVEDHPGNSGPYDMLQAVEAAPASLSAVPDRVNLDTASPEADIGLKGPHVLSWTASSDVPWLEVTPSSGAAPATVTLALRRGATGTGTVTFEATGDGMSFSKTVTVQVGTPPRRAGRRVSPAP